MNNKIHLVQQMPHSSYLVIGMGVVLLLLLVLGVTRRSSWSVGAPAPSSYGYLPCCACVGGRQMRVPADTIDDCVKKPGGYLSCVCEGPCPGPKGLTGKIRPVLGTM